MGVDIYLCVFITETTSLEYSIPRTDSSANWDHIVPKTD